MKDYVKTFLTPEAAGQFAKTGLIGVANTLVSFAIFNTGRAVGASVFWSVTFGWIVATYMSYLLNRRWSFRLNDGGENVKETVRFAMVNVAAWAVTVGLMSVAQRLFELDRLGENVALLVVSVIVLLPKFATYRDIVFRKALDEVGEKQKTA